MRSGSMAEQRRLFFVNVAIIICTIAAMSIVCIYSVAKDLTDDRTFARGITVNGLDISGMTFSDAQRRLERYCEDQLGESTLLLTYNGAEYTHTVSELGGVADVKGTLEKAFNIGKTADESGAVLENFSMSTELWLQMNVDRDKLAGCIESIAETCDDPAVDAQASFDKVNRTFSYTEGKPGHVIDVEACVDGIEKMLSVGDFTTFELISCDDDAVTVEELKENTKLIGSYRTDTTANANRNTNISLMCSYVNGYVLMPGDILSINDLVGPRTAEKGFMEAPAIIDGKLEDGLGGGICQLSGTLYNAAMLANMNIVERLPHTWPSDYLPIGLDSTLDWDTQKDLKIQNMSSYPIYIAAWLAYGDLSSKNELNVEIYGQPLPEGMTIKIRHEITETIVPDSENRVYVNTLSAGKRKVVSKEHIGYRTKVWRDFYLNGELVDSEPMSSSYYRPIPAKVEVGAGGQSSGSQSKPKPTPKPEETPSVPDVPTYTEPVYTEPPYIPDPQPVTDLPGAEDNGSNGED